MKNALILHGTDATSHDNWFQWLKGQLEDRDYQVWAPDLPGADQPNIKRYNQFLLGSDFDFNRETLIVGHSSGAVAILGLLQRLPEDVAVGACVLVSAFKSKLGWNALDGLFEEPFDFGLIQKKADKFVFIHSDNDPHVPLDHAKYLADKVYGELVVVPGQGHFNIKNNPKYTEFPKLLSLIQEEQS